MINRTRQPSKCLCLFCAKCVSCGVGAARSVENCFVRACAGWHAMLRLPSARGMARSTKASETGMRSYFYLFSVSQLRVTGEGAFLERSLLFIGGTAGFLFPWSRPLEP